MKVKNFLMVTLMAACGSVISVADVLEVSAAAQPVQQRTQRRPSRRVTNPVRGQVPPLASTTEGTDAEIISTADDDAANLPTRNAGTNRNQTSTGNRNSSIVPRPAAPPPAPTVDPDVLRAQLSNSLYQSEQRAQGYQQQLVEVQEKQDNVQARLDQIAVEIEPENVELANAGSGSGRPELARERIRRRLENERTRLNAQLQTLSNSRTRLESVIASTDADIERLRARLGASETNVPTNTLNAAPQNPITPENTVTPAARDGIVPPQR
ncbi:MAG: hypothetical protein MSG64_06790 [Pyrinomonadaceae bacterium MAG19_C2-C3]|nr:hypothetical protein [Pyrinomonadaceae bacterium MAG19_C2-C3]